MARVPEAELERLKAEVSLERLAEARGVQLRRHGADLLGLCPFHDDHEPSLLISPAKNLWHCMGACQAGGSVIDWVMRERGVSFRHAVELLRDLPFVAELPRRGTTVRTLAAPVAPDADDAELLRQVVGYYHVTLKELPEAQAYLEQRGLRNAELVERFQLGFANRTLGLRLPLGNRKAGADIRTRLQRLGIIRESGHEHFNGSLVVPVADRDGQITEVYGRKITSGLRQGTPLHLYLPGPHRGVWNEAALAVSEEVIVCEALLDALTFWCHGLRNVTSAYGVEGFTDDHLAALQHHQVKRVLIAYDRDAAGDKAAVQLAVRLVAAGIDAFRVQFPQGEDVNSFACGDLHSAADRLAERVRRAVWLGQGTPPTRPTLDTAPPSPARVILGRPRQTQLRAAKGSVGNVPLMSLPPFAADSEPAAEPEPPLASPLPPAPARDAAEQGDGDELVLCFGDRRWRIRGLDKVTSFDLLRVNVLVSRDNEQPAFHVDTLDLYSARQRAVFCKQASDELCVAEDVIHRELGRVLLCCEERAQERIREQMAPQQREVSLSDADEAAALELLRDPTLCDRILADLDACGIVGEETNKLVAYLAVVSRKLERPLAVVVQSSSAAGKSALLEGVLALVPEEERVKYSALTGQSLFYMEGQQLAHKVLALMEEEGAERAAYALKLLQSEGELSIASTGKDPATGRLVTHEYRVTGPVAILLTTTAVDVDEELLNRCLVLAVDEEREQTRAIHVRQREAETLDGLLRSRERDHVVALHRNAQRLLRPLLVVNPYAPQLRFVDSRTRTRRDHTKYLTLIRAITLLHQYQRERRTTHHRGEVVTYIEVIAADIALANRLADSVLGRSLDELPPQTRRLLTILDGHVRTLQDEHGLERSDVRVTRRELREHCGWGDTQLRLHLARLCELEHVIAHRDGRSVRYELLWDGRGDDGAPVLSGLLDPVQLQAYDDKAAGSAPTLPGSEAVSAGQMRPRNGPDAGQVRGAVSMANGNSDKGFTAPPVVDTPKSTDTGKNNGVVVPAEFGTPLAAEGR